MKTTIYAAAMALAATSASALTHNEAGDASNFYASAQVAGAGIDLITGSIGIDDLGDLYRLTTGATAGLTITVENSALDTILMLFDATGAGILADDDEGVGLQSQITTGALAAGDYLIGVLDWRGGAYDAETDFWDGAFQANAAPPANFGTLINIENTSIISQGDYSITIAGAAAPVPLPASLPLLGAALAGLGLLRRRKRG